ELALFPGRDAAGERLQDKPAIAAANKIDALDDPSRLARLRDHVAAQGIQLFPISAVTGEGLPPLLEAIWAQLVLAEQRSARPEAAQDDPRLASHTSERQS
ncbi:MAG: hypothetical protein ACRD1V_18565, partial [Vicinamibacterales bacterium]